MCETILQLYRSVVRFLAGYFNAFYFDLDLIKDVDSAVGIPEEEVETSKYSSSSKHYLPPLIIMMAHLFDNLLVLYRAKFKYGYEGLDDLISRKIYPKKLWLQGDAMFYIGTAIEILIFTLLLVRPSIESKYRIYAVKAGGKLISNRKVWKRKYSEKILHFRTNARFGITVLMALAFMQTFSYWMLNAYTNFTGSTRDKIIFANLPLFAIFAVFGEYRRKFIFYRI